MDGAKTAEKIEDLIAADQRLEALRQLQDAHGEDCPDPLIRSYWGYLMVSERGQVTRGLATCRQVVASQDDDPRVYVNLARALLHVEKKHGAIDTLRQGLARHPQSEPLQQLVASLGIRRQPVVASLPRNHPVNKFLGKLAARLRRG